MERSSHTPLGVAADQRLAFALSRKCPVCGCAHLRRSTIHSEDEEQLRILLSPYRCNDCGERFWTISRKARHTAIGIVVLMLVGLLVALLLGGLATPQLQASARSSGAANTVAEAERTVAEA